MGGVRSLKQYTPRNLCFSFFLAQKFFFGYCFGCLLNGGSFGKSLLWWGVGLEDGLIGRRPLQELYIFDFFRGTNKKAQVGLGKPKKLDQNHVVHPIYGGFWILHTTVPIAHR